MVVAFHGSKARTAEQFQEQSQDREIYKFEIMVYLYVSVVTHGHKIGDHINLTDIMLRT